VLVLDNGPVHTTRVSTAALNARPWITAEWLSRYAPELNNIELTWRDLKRYYRARRMFREVDHRETVMHTAIRELNRERQARLPCDKS
jgi:transposase